MKDIPAISGTLKSGLTFGLMVSKPASTADLRAIAELIIEMANKLDADRPAGSAPGEQ